MALEDYKIDYNKYKANVVEYFLYGNTYSEKLDAKIRKAWLSNVSPEDALKDLND